MILTSTAGSTNMRSSAAVAALFQSAARTLRTSPCRARSTVRLPARGRLVVTGDLHDNPTHLAKLMRLARVHDSPDHHVVLHELIHGEDLVSGLDFSHRMLARVAELVVSHPGQVHPLLANHELAQMTGREVSKGAGDRVAIFNAALEFVYGHEWVDVSEALCDFIRAMPIALLTESGVLCAHSLPDAKSLTRFRFNLLSRDLTDVDYMAPAGSAYLMVWGRAYTDDSVDALAMAWDVNTFFLGHEHAPDGILRRGRRVIVLNTDHAHGAVVSVDLTKPCSPEQALRLATPISGIAG